MGVYKSSIKISLSHLLKNGRRRNMKSIEQTAYEIITDESIIFEKAEEEIERLIENTRMKFLSKLHSVNKKRNYNIFIEKECIFGDSYYISKVDFYDAYKQWCLPLNYKIYHIDNIITSLQFDYKITFQSANKKFGLTAGFNGIKLNG